MLTKVITTNNEFYALENEWERLQEQDPEITYYSTFEYNKIWWDVNKDDVNKSLFIICVYFKNKILGIAPLIIEKVPKKIFSYKTLKFMGFGDYLNFIIERNNKSEYTIIKCIIEAAASNANKFERVQLTHIKYNSILAAFLMSQKKYNDNFKILIECPVFIKNNFKSYDDYKQSVVSPNISKYVNKLKSDFKYNFIVLSNGNDELLDKLSEVHIEEQEFLNEEKNIKTRKSLFKNKRGSEFIKKIYNENNNIITFILESEDKEIIAYSLCYCYRKILYGWNMAYNVKYRKYCVGKVLIYEIVKYLFESNIADVYDFGAGRYPWKFEWANCYNINYKLYMWNTKTTKGKILKFLYKVKKIITCTLCNQ